MTLHGPTLVSVLVLVSAILSSLLALSWMQNRSVSALGWWGLGFLFAAIGISLLGGRGRIPDFLSIDIANAASLLAYGFAWHGCRMFCGRPGNWAVVIGGAAFWVAACRWPAFYELAPLRVIVASMLLVSYSGACAAELWRGSKGLPTRRVTALIFAAHGVVLVGRIPGAVYGMPRAKTLNDLFAEPLYPVMIFETLVFTISVAFLMLSASKEQLEEHHRRAALLDPLTGVANRRGFFADAARVVRRDRRARRPTALVLLDLDHFKTVNDTWGHQAGDRVLRSFCETITSVLREEDVLGRIGGEEFAIVLPDTNREAAAAVAERIRAAVAEIAVPSSDKAITVTASMGVAADNVASIEDLFAAADAALYRAKESGRDRIEFAPPLPDPATVQMLSRAA